MSTGDLHTLTGAYALGALSGREGEEFGEHLAECEACTQEVRELRETAARLALAVAETPPPALRERVMAALPEVRQLPPARRGSRPPSARPRWRQRLPYLAAAACLVLAAVAAGLAVGGDREASEQRARAARAEQQAAALSALMAAPDATFSTRALKGGGNGTVVASQQLGQAAFVYRGLPPLPDRRVYQLWYSRNGVMVPAGLLEHGRSTGSTLLVGGPRGADGVGVTVEPEGGSPRPTSAPLVLLSL
ncbi:anti-sigma factor domain-containing protein [Peterkaempfera sp. SMS 1(5)a]|uniref:anti-sigma factor n=1 Tax=Peterkaempfera podocarpi TaxID=3232308 RepID=UPI00367214A3